MQHSKLNKFKKNSKIMRLRKLYLDLIKTKHILNFFMGRLKKRQLVKLYKVVSKKQLFLNFLLKLECRLDFILMKSGFVLSGHQARQLILHKQVFINSIVARSSSIFLKKLDLVSISPSFIKNYKFLLMANFFKTISFFKYLKKKKRIPKKLTVRHFFIYLKFPRFVEVNFRTSSFIVVKRPLLREFILPKSLSVYDFGQLYFIA